MKVADTKIESASLKDIVIEKSSSKLYVNNRGNGRISVINTNWTQNLFPSIRSLAEGVLIS